MWSDFHKYTRYAKEGKVHPLVCPDCQSNLAIRMKPDDASSDLYLWCYVDDIYIKPGLEMHHQITNAIRNVELQRSSSSDTIENTD